MSNPSIDVEGGSERVKGGMGAKPMPKGLMKAFTRLNVWVYKLTGGRMMSEMNGTPVCLVTMTGRKSGKKRTIPLMYNPSGDDVVLVASMGGAPKHPIWYHNLVAHPDIDVQVRGKGKRKMRVRQASDDEKAVLWPSLEENFPNFSIYAARTDRNIPVMICSPAGT
ncbi:MAG: nitroreductase family deazaflavin-dependent oxidoreductase [Alphaproteobacteria bacterium]